MKALLAVVGLAVVSALVPLSEHEYQRRFTEFVSTYNKQYSAENFFTKYNTFKENLDMIREHNEKGKSWQMGMNHFGDLNAAEWKEFVGTFPPQMPSTSGTFKPTKGQAPDEWDWRPKGAVNPVKNQAQCGSCWAFSTVGALEGWAFITKSTGGTLPNLSEQQIVDCSKDGCYGCQGGWPYKAMEYVMSHGLCSQTSYPYTARDGRCNDATCEPLLKAGALKGYTNVSGEAGLVDAIYQGPVSVLVEADRSAFQFYKSGVLDDPSCGQTIDHAITAVGYGVENGKPYYAIKNSWGASWGDQGYIRLVRGSNQCGINDGPVQPMY